MTRALCHPKRLHEARGLCKQCVAKEVAGPPPTVAQAIVRKHRQELMALHEETAYVEALGRTAKAVLTDNLPEYADLHITAARVAAEKGDARPSEWALQHVKTKDKPVVEPAPKEAPQSGVRVYVGINMGGVPTDALPTIAVTVPVTDPPQIVE